MTFGCDHSATSEVATDTAAAPGAAAPSQPTSFDATLESLQQYSTPEWLRDAKLGIYIHWGAYSVAERGEWYARKLYLQGTPEYKHHLENYGHRRVGYNFIPMWKAEKWIQSHLLVCLKKPVQNISRLPLFTTITLTYGIQSTTNGTQLTWSKAISLANGQQQLNTTAYALV